MFVIIKAEKREKTTKQGEKHRDFLTRCILISIKIKPNPTEHERAP